MSQQSPLSESSEDLLVAYVLGILPIEDIHQLSTLMGEHPELQQDMAELRRVVDALPYALPDAVPPPDLRDRIVARAEGTLSQSSKTLSVSRALRPWWQRPWLTALSGALAALLLVITLSLQLQSANRQATIQSLQGQLAQQQSRADALQSQATTLQSQSAEQQAALQKLQQQVGQLQGLTDERQALIALLANPDINVSIGTSDHGNVTFVRSAQGDALVAQLPQLQQGRTYQLWLIEGSDTPPNSAGTFSVDQQGHGVLVVSNPPVASSESAIFAITNEPEGGSPAPTTDVLVSGQTIES
jgi:anti-sigma-K factor RskA